jgi:hypothetical protein
VSEATATLPEPLSLGTIMRLNTRTWVEPVGTDTLPMLMLTYPAPQFDEVDPAVVESAMRRVAEALGAEPFSADVPDVGVRFTLHPPHGLLWFTNSSYALKITHVRWLRALKEAGGAVLGVGLDELSTVASVAEVDEYREHARRHGRMHFAFGHVGRPLGGAR